MHHINTHPYPFLVSTALKRQILVKNQLDTLLATARLRNQRRLDRQRRALLFKQDRRPLVLEAGRTHRAMLKLRARTDAEHRRYISSPQTASIPALDALAAELRQLTDRVRQLAPKCRGSIAGNAMNLQMREDANLAMRLVRRIAALPHPLHEPEPLPPMLPELAPLREPPKPQEVHFDFGPLAHEFVGPLQPERPHSDYWWDQQLKRLDGSLGEWKAQRKAAKQAYAKTTKAKKVRDRYRKSEKGRESAKKAYQAYAQSEKGKAARQRAAASYRARHKKPAEHNK